MLITHNRKRWEAVKVTWRRNLIPLSSFLSFKFFATFLINGDMSDTFGKRLIICYQKIPFICQQTSVWVISSIIFNKIKCCLSYPGWVEYYLLSFSFKGRLWLRGVEWSNQKVGGSILSACRSVLGQDTVTLKWPIIDVECTNCESPWIKPSTNWHVM